MSDPLDSQRNAPPALPPMPEQPPQPKTPGQALDAALVVLLRLAKACARTWSALDRSSQAVLVCAVAFVAIVALPDTSPRFPYNVTDLGTLGGPDSFANGINNSGQVVGGADTGRGLSPLRGIHAFLWQSTSGMQDLGTLGTDHSVAHGINDAGQVVGVVGGAYTVSSSYHAFLWQAASGMQDLGTLGGSNSEAVAINNIGQVVGSADTTENGDGHAFLWQAGRGMQDLGTLGRAESEAHGINDAGQVVGIALSPHLWRPFLWQRGSGMQELGTIVECVDGAQEGRSDACAINSGGNAVGKAGIREAGRVFVHDKEWRVVELHAVLWQAGGGFNDLGMLAGGNESEAHGVNATGQIVGASSTSSGDHHAFLYSDGQMTDLDTMIDRASGWRLNRASAINGHGQIVGAGRNRAGQFHAFLLTPAPRRPSLLLWGLAVAAVLAAAWRLRAKWWHRRERAG